MKLEFAAVPGKAHSGTLLLNNSAGEKVHVRTEILDFYVDQNQTPQFVAKAPSEAAFSCRDWISVNPMETDIAAGANLSARYTVRVPADAAAGSRHCAIGFVSVPSPLATPGVGVRTSVRVVTTLYPVVGTPVADGDIVALSLDSVNSGPKQQWRGIVTLENKSSMFFRPKGAVEVLDSQGTIVETLELTSFPVLPKRQQRFIVPLKKQLAAGDYSLRARIDFGKDVQEAATAVSISTSGR